MIPAPGDQWRILLGGIRNVVGGEQALGVTPALGVPGQAGRL